MLLRVAFNPLLLLVIAFAYAPAGLGQVLTEQQVSTVQQRVADTGGELAAMRGFESGLGLPSGLTRAQSEALATELWDAYGAGIILAGGAPRETLGALPPTMAELTEDAAGGRLRIAARTMPLGAFDMPFALIRREPSGVPETGRPLFICTHGGGQKADASGPHAWTINTREWQTQTQFAIELYQPEGLYFVPRMADDRLGRWRHAHHQDQFDLVIRHAVLFWGIDPNRVYKLGISQGGFASAILGVFMPDRFAGINPMAGGVGLGNPVENLRNLPCYTSVGENDTMFNRAGHAIAFHERLDELRAQDPGGYPNHLDLQPGRGHGIDYRPGAPWIAQHTRDPHPDKVVWTSKTQDGRRRPSLYWLELSGEDLKGTIALTASLNRERNAVELTAHQLATQVAQGDPTQIGEQAAQPAPLTGAAVSVLLNDHMLDLDRPVTITCNGVEVFADPVQRSGDTLLETLVQRGDRHYAFPVRVRVNLK